MRCAIYCRLSKEDINIGTNSVAESESIQNQKLMLRNYAKAKGWNVVGIYCDEDYSGSDVNRPQFTRLLKDAELGKFDIILCKTQSRFTRDMELAERYINNKFLLWGIRFVSIVDNVDTSIFGNKKARQINSLVNEWYLEDLSYNIKTVFDYKRRNGQYIASFPIYGYKKLEEDKNKIVPDEESATVVRFIFSLVLENKKPNDIANILNALIIPSPARYKQLVRKNYIPPSSSKTLLWSRVAVSRIISNEMYIGTMVQGKRRKLSYKHSCLSSVPKDEWIRVEDNHEALISKDVFNKANKKLAPKKTIKKGNHSLSGLVFCGECGKPLVYSSYTSNGKKYIYLRCLEHKVNIAESRLEKIISYELCKKLQEKGIKVNPKALDYKKCTRLFTHSAFVDKDSIIIKLIV